MIITIGDTLYFYYFLIHQLKVEYMQITQPYVTIDLSFLLIHYNLHHQ